MRSCEVAGFTELRSAPSYPGWAADAEGNVYRDGNEVPGWIVQGRVIVSVKGNKAQRAHIVADAWYGPKPADINGKRVVCRHLNDNSLDDRPENLRWGTHSQNSVDMVNNGNHNKQVLSEKDVLEIRKLYATGDYRQTELADIYGVTQPLISAIVLHKVWSHI